MGDKRRKKFNQDIKLAKHDIVFKYIDIYMTVSVIKFGNNKNIRSFEKDTYWPILILSCRDTGVAIFKILYHPPPPPPSPPSPHAGMCCDVIYLLIEGLTYWHKLRNTSYSRTTISTI